MEAASVEMQHRAGHNKPDTTQKDEEMKLRQATLEERGGHKRGFLRTRTLVLASMLGALLFGGCFLTAPKPYMPEPRNLPDEADFLLEEKVGWYRLDDGTTRLLTWGAENGLTLSHFHRLRDSLRFSQLKPKSRTTFIWERAKQNYEIQFERNQAGTISGFQWRDATGQQRQAERLYAYGYQQQEVEYVNGDVKLTGTLMLPLTSERKPAVVFIHGSGVSDRNNFWYLHQADYLARHGFVVLLPDKRGCGKSEGTWHTASFDDFAGDVVAAVDYLSQQDQVDTGQIGILGISQGGWIAPLAAQQSPKIRFVISVSGSIATPAEQVRYEVKNEIDEKAPGFIASLLASPFARRAKKRMPVWWEKNEFYDSLEMWKAYTLPVLLIYGEQDRNVDVGRSLARLSEAHIQRQNLLFDIQVYPDTGHGLFDSETRWIKVSYLDFLVEWLTQTTSRTDVFPLR